MSINILRSTRTAAALLCVTAVAALAAGCSSQDTTAKKDNKADPAVTASVLVVDRASTGFDSALEHYYTAAGKYPQTATYDGQESTLTLDVPNEASDTVEDASTFKPGVKLGWYVNYPDTRFDADDGATDTGQGNFSYCLSGKNNHKITTANPTVSSAEVGEGPCPKAPTKT